MPGQDDTEERVLEAAGQVFAEKGFEGAKIRAICKRAGVNIAAVNYYFRDKERLYVEAVKRAAGISPNEPPVPRAGPEVPPAVRLRDFIHWLVAHMMAGDRPAWHTPLMMRELAQPTSACAELVRDYIRPVSDVLWGILQEVLPPDTPAWKRFMTMFSIVGQCIHYVQNKPILRQLAGEEYRHFTPEAVAEHITAFSLAALGLQEAGRPGKQK